MTTNLSTATLFLVALLLLLTVGSSCSDPYKLSDEAVVKSFSIIAFTPSDIKINDPIMKGDTIVLPLVKGKYSFPIQITAIVETGSPSQQLLNIDFSEPIKFASMAETNSFYVGSESGLPRKYTIVLRAEAGEDDNDVESFVVTEPITPSDAELVREGVVFANEHEGFIAIKVETDGFPLSFAADIVTSRGATSSIDPSSLFSFESESDVVSFTVTSHSGKTKVWSVYLLGNKPQLINHNLEQWIDNNTPVGWATANNLFTKGTKQKTDPVFGKVAQLTTSKVDIVKQIASASLFLGRFELNIEHMDNPPMMTFMGVPFTGKPNEVKINLKYAPGAKLEKTVNGQFVPVNGTDQGKIIIELLHYSGAAGEFEYHGFDNTPNVEVLARYLERVNSTNGAWTNKSYPLTLSPLAKQPNYISVVFASSADGDSFVGADGSTLWIDSVELVYTSNE